MWLSRNFGVIHRNVFRLQFDIARSSSDDIEKARERQRMEKNVSASRKTLEMLRDEFARYRRGQFYPPAEKVPRHVDIAIVGGGIIGSSIAYFLKNRAPDSFDLMVAERDPTYTRSSTTLSVGGIRQQFSLPENIKLSMYSAEFLRNIKHHLSVLDEDPPDIQFQPHGYLFLASEAGAGQMIKSHRTQRELGAKVDLFSPKQLSEKFPWLNTEGIEMGSYGAENEGWFDPWALLRAFRRKAASLGAKYVDGEVIGFEFHQEPESATLPGVERRPTTNYMYLKDLSGEVHIIEFGILVVCAGPHSNEVAKMLNIGNGPGMLKVPLPVEPRKRYVYCFRCENGPGIDLPLVIDPTGAYVRREGLGGCYIAGRSPSESEEPDNSNLDVDYNFFDNSVWPVIANRVPAFESIKVSSAWAGYYDYNTLDQNALVGRHPYYNNVYFATGFSGHGIQMAPGVGRAMMELLLDQEYISINMSRFGIERVLTDEPVFERNIV